MNRKSIFLLVFMMILSLGLLASCGSSSSSTSSEEPQYADEDFITSLAKGLEARWALSDQVEGEATVQDFKNYIQAELDQVEQYKDSPFEDSKLQEKALAYINILKESMDNVDYAFSDDQYDKWLDVYDQRTMMIKDFVDNYGLTVSEKNQSNLDEIIANGKTAGEQATQKEVIEKLVKDLKFKKTKEEYDWKTYQAVLENTTDYDIKDLSLEISLLDDDGVIVETAYVSAENLAKGKKAKLEFQTDKSFDKYETVVSWFEVE